MCTIMLDFDGPLALCVESELFSWANQLPSIKTAWNYTRLIETGDWEAATSLPKDQISLIYQQFTQTSAYPGLTPTPGAVAALQSIPAHHRHLATARPHNLSVETTQFVISNFGFFRDYHFNVHADKIALATKLAARFVVDDCYPLLCRIARETAAQPILFPKRTKRNVTSNHGVTVLDVESAAYPGISLNDFQQICVRAWAQITAIISNCAPSV